MKLLLVILHVMVSSLAIDSAAVDSVVTDSTIVDSVHLIMDDMPNVVMHMDSSVRHLIQDKMLGRQPGEQVVDGFRIQIYSSNNQQIAKNEALLREQQVLSLVDIPVYTVVEPPFWKIRIGNFLTREEAEAYKATFLTLFPDWAGSTYVVADKVILN